MSTVAALPSSLQHKLMSLARTIRGLRLLRGTCWLLLLTSLVAGAALLSDACLDLPAIARGCLLALWVGSGLGTLVFALVMPLSRRFESSALAGLIERRYPELLERLTSTVELTGPVDIHHGSPQFIDFLVKETERQTGHLDFRQAVPKDRTGRLAWGAVIAVLALVIPAVIWPQRAKELAGRFLMPWRDPVAAPAFTIEVTPGDTFVGRGQSLNIVATLQSENEKAERPRSGKVVITQDGGVKTFRMEVERSDQFALKVPRDLVSKDFDYHV
ncbi:MAG TPA: hypothetical protein VGZ25_10735, partial [Gemmataceae bacterium]|nr:hypothetical protein [Gemmataceae bacterium]